MAGRVLNPTAIPQLHPPQKHLLNLLPEGEAPPDDLSVVAGLQVSCSEVLVGLGFSRISRGSCYDDHCFKGRRCIFKLGVDGPA